MNTNKENWKDHIQYRGGQRSINTSEIKPETNSSSNIPKKKPIVIIESKPDEVPPVFTNTAGNESSLQFVFDKVQMACLQYINIKDSKLRNDKASHQKIVLNWVLSQYVSEKTVYDTKELLLSGLKKLLLAFYNARAIIKKIEGKDIPVDLLNVKKDTDVINFKQSQSKIDSLSMLFINKEIDSDSSQQLLPISDLLDSKYVTCLIELNDILSSFEANYKEAKIKHEIVLGMWIYNISNSSNDKLYSFIEELLYHFKPPVTPTEFADVLKNAFSLYESYSVEELNFLFNNKQNLFYALLLPYHNKTISNNSQTPFSIFLEKMIYKNNELINITKVTRDGSTLQIYIGIFMLNIIDQMRSKLHGENLDMELKTCLEMIFNKYEAAFLAHHKNKSDFPNLLDYLGVVLNCVVNEINDVLSAYHKRNALPKENIDRVESKISSLLSSTLVGNLSEKTILASAGSVPKFVSLSFNSKQVEKVINGLTHEVENARELLNRLQEIRKWHDKIKQPTPNGIEIYLAKHVASVFNNNLGLKEIGKAFDKLVSEEIAMFTQFSNYWMAESQPLLTEVSSRINSMIKNSKELSNKKLSDVSSDQLHNALETIYQAELDCDDLLKYRFRDLNNLLRRLREWSISQLFNLQGELLDKIQKELRNQFEIKFKIQYTIDDIYLKTYGLWLKENTSSIPEKDEKKCIVLGKRILFNELIAALNNLMIRAMCHRINALKDKPALLYLLDKVNNHFLMEHSVLIEMYIIIKEIIAVAGKNPQLAKILQVDEVRPDQAYLTKPCINFNELACYVKDLITSTSGLNTPGMFLKASNEFLALVKLIKPELISSGPEKLLFTQLDSLLKNWLGTFPMTANETILTKHYFFIASEFNQIMRGYNNKPNQSAWYSFFKLENVFKNTNTITNTPEAIELQERNWFEMI